MTKPISDYTVDELSAKIEAIKAEREKTADALKRYEKELERRKQEIPLGVPSKFKSNMYYFLNSKNEVICPTTLDNKLDGLDRQLACNIFDSYKSAEKHAEMLLDWRKDGLVSNAKGEPMDIKVLCPLLKKGKVCYSPELGWAWCSNDGKITCGKEQWYSTGENWLLNAFNLKPAEDWRNSLMECGL